MRQQYRTSGAGCAKSEQKSSGAPLNCGYHCTNIKTSKSKGLSDALPYPFKNFLGCATAILCNLVFSKTAANALSFRQGRRNVVDSEGDIEKGALFCTIGTSGALSRQKGAFS